MYQVIYLTGDYDTSNAKLAPQGSTGNYKYIMTADLDSTADSTHPDRKLKFYGTNVILDLAGQTLTVSGYDNTYGYDSNLNVYCENFALIDSSPTHAGRVYSSGIFLQTRPGATAKNVTIAGGELVGECRIKCYNDNTNLAFTGGSWGKLTYSYYSGVYYPASITVAPWMTATYNADGRVTSAVGYRETKVIAGVEYLVIPLTGDFDSTAKKLAPQGDAGNYLYVMTADLDCTADATQADRRLWLYGTNVLWDLNGYTLTMSGLESIGGKSYFSFFCVFDCEYFAIIDSSADQSGKVISKDLLLHAERTQAVELSGGTLVGSGRLKFITATELAITGGDWRNIVYDGYYPTTTTVPPYMQTIVDQNGHITARAYDCYAVSRSNLVSGVYNHAYGLAWNLTVAELKDLVVPPDQTYYLWARNGAEWYEALNVSSETALGDFTTWQKYFNNEAITLDGNTVTFNTKGGHEILGLPVKVAPHTDYAFSVDVTASHFLQGSLQGLTFAVTAEKPNCDGNTLVNNTILNSTQIVPNYQGTVGLTFNSGDLDTVYLVLNAGGISDGQTVSFIFDNLCLRGGTFN